ncbi:MAG: flagellar biosynthesis protein FlhF, partial [Campylobacterales bacterium]|nr:flagellar biosynthesis protein FlhF [Campylobacterales bacterium]
MNFLTFTGETPAQALKKAQNECGEDAYVISTKQVKKKSLNSPGLYEVIVALEESMPKPKEIKREDSEDVLLNISEAAKQISKIANVSTDKKLKESKELPLTESFSTKELGTIKQEINKLADKIKLIQEMFWDEKAPQRDNLAIPSEFAQIYKLAMQSGMSKEHLNTIMRLTLEHMPTRMKSSSETVKRYFQVLLRKMIPVRHESTLNKGQQKVMMFVGPTGVGKTTTLAKLAARYSYLAQQRYKVGIITLDTYRIGAVEQLFQYAKMMRLPVEDVVDINDF